MDISELGELLSDRPVPDGQVGNTGKAIQRLGEVKVDFEDERRKKVARDFESIFVHEILKSMKDTIPDSDMADSSSQQIKSMYWSFMADAIADRGGFGLWKQIYELMPQSKAEDTNDGAPQKQVSEQEGTDHVTGQRLDESI